ncbi:MAG: hypothetical protein EXQ74_05420 [Thermoleophilia bacterium]|nr:hypothetical protein [Thermoleophilia bacterium]
MSTDDPTPARQVRLRQVCFVLGVVGAVLSVLAMVVALGVTSFGGVFEMFSPRSGGWGAAITVLMALITVGGVVVVRRSPGLGSALMYVGGCGGFLASGGIWLIPGTVTLIAANLALWGITDPFRDGPVGTRNTTTRT